MAAYLITGPSASGKSSIGAELHRRGYRVIDADDAFGYFGDVRDERPVEFPGNSDVSEEWYRFNGWLWDRRKVDLALAARRTVFICGGAENEIHFYGRFRKIFRLHLDPTALQDRLAARDRSCATNNPAWVRASLRALEANDGEAFRVVPISTASCSVEDSADAILAHISESMPEAVARCVVGFVRRRYLWAKRCWRRIVGKQT